MASLILGLAVPPLLGLIVMLAALRPKTPMKPSMTPEEISEWLKNG